MCLSTVYELGAGNQKKQLGEYVSALEVRGGTVTLTDIMGSEVSVTGTIQRVDLVENTILISARPSMTAVNQPEPRRFELIREIFNECDRNQMRDIAISEVETDDLERQIRPFLTGRHVTYEKRTQDDRVVIFNINTDGMEQRLTFTEITP
jgi:predicted RNA-binding protein